jgi:hypothetical protein
MTEPTRTQQLREHAEAVASGPLPKWISLGTDDLLALLDVADAAQAVVDAWAVTPMPMPAEQRLRDALNQLNT